MFIWTNTFKIYQNGTLLIVTKIKQITAFQSYPTYFLSEGSFSPFCYNLTSISIKFSKRDIYYPQTCLSFQDFPTNMLIPSNTFIRFFKIILPIRLFHPDRLLGTLEYTNIVICTIFFKPYSICQAHCSHIRN